VTTPKAARAAACPVTGVRSEQKTNPNPPHRGPAVTRDADGTYHVHAFDAARELLRGEGTRQAGFGAELLGAAPTLQNDPVLFLEGEAHHQMRRETARYFTPATVATYRRMMERLADDLVGELVRTGTARLDDLSLRMAVQVAARVVGLTHSHVPGLSARVARFVQNDFTLPDAASSARAKLQAALNHAQILAFFLLDVKPAIRARRREPGEDVISHLLAKNYQDLEILTECITYATAGMVTTREFISVAAWHLMERPDLRREYLHGTERERHGMLHEILRLEPVVAELRRRATRDLTVDGHRIPEGSLIVLHVHSANADETTVGDAPLTLCPNRALPRGVPGPVMSFGDGHHRCPGAYVAIQEADILLRRLLWLRDLRVVTPPTVTWNGLIKGYELRNFMLAVGP